MTPEVAGQVEERTSVQRAGGPRPRSMLEVLVFPFKKVNSRQYEFPSIKRRLALMMRICFVKIGNSQRCKFAPIKEEVRTGASFHFSIRPQLKNRETAVFMGGP